MAAFCFDHSARRVFDVGTRVRFKDDYLEANPDSKKRFAGRIGIVSGYRAGASEPIVEFPQDGRRKEVKLFEVRNAAIEAVPL